MIQNIMTRTHQETGPKDMSGDRDMRPVHKLSLGPLLSTGVQPTEETEDLRKVKLDSASRNLERTPVMVGGKLERFRDIGNMITTWDVLEQDDKEWMVEEGVRRGGRKISRRMSKLIGIFGDENDRVIGQTIDVVFGEDTNLCSLSSISASLCSNVNFSTETSKKTENVQVINYNKKGFISVKLQILL